MLGEQKRERMERRIFRDYPGTPTHIRTPTKISFLMEKRERLHTDMPQIEDLEPNDYDGSSLHRGSRSSSIDLFMTDSATSPIISRIPPNQCVYI